MPEEKKSDLVEIGALWISEARTGRAYLSGRLGNARLLVFRNKFKETDKHPDYKVFVANTEKRGSSDRRSEIETKEDPVERGTSQPAYSDDLDTDIPF